MAATNAEEVFEPLCRRVGRTVVKCPRCAKDLQLKTLTYRHRCRNSFSIEQRLAAIQQRQLEEDAARTTQQRPSAIQQQLPPRKTPAELIAASLSRRGA
jgi:hypothetical protein